MSVSQNNVYQSSSAAKSMGHITNYTVGKTIEALEKNLRKVILSVARGELLNLVVNRRYTHTLLSMHTRWNDETIQCLCFASTIDIMYLLPLKPSSVQQK